jgi:hypothetical protein
VDGELFIVRFDYKGAWFLCQRSGSLLVYQGATQSGASLPLPPAMAIAPNTGTTPYTSTLAGLPYQVVRLPRRIGNPLEMPAGTCIDLAYSGIGPTDLPLGPSLGPTTVGMYQYDSNGNVPAGIYPLQAMSIMFAPDGGIDSVFLNNWFFSPTTAVHLLVGRADKVNPPLATSTTSATALNMFDPVSSNLADPLSLWVSVSRSTGAVNTSDNMPPSLSAISGTSATITSSINQQKIDPTTAAGQATYLQFCRQLATSREQAKTQ